MPRAVLAVVAFAKHASDASVGWPELDKSATPLRNSSRKICRSHPTITHTHNNLSATMVFPAIYPSPPDTHVSAPLPEVPKEDDSMAQWAQHTGYVQQEPVDGTNFDFEGLDALLGWELGDTLPEPTPASQLGGGLDFDWATIMAGDMPGNSALDLLGTAPFAATAPVPAPPSLPTNIDFTSNIFDLPVST
ncbi:hypothetical protein H4582DRAFT_1421089 [Lactarius indigo]|nr:hypothetical protein H4582DRAFT_1421089 [Lactarius indigo]